jgi:hypothetical protein
MVGADVIFGEPGGSQLFAALRLWRELKPSPMILGWWRSLVTLASAGDSNGDFIW